MTRKLNLRSIPKKFLLNHPDKILLYPIIRKVYSYTMLRYAPLCQVYDAVKDIDKNKIPGAIVEMGCYNGGCGALMAWTTKKNGSKRRVWLFDSFQGLPEAGQEDMERAKILNIPIKYSDEIKTSNTMVASRNNVEKISDMIGTREFINIIPGWFQDTVPTNKNEIGPIAILRLDGDIYESTKFCLENLYDQVAQGGYIIVDDYKNWAGCRRALYEFFYKRNINPYLKEYPFGVVFFKKDQST